MTRIEEIITRAAHVPKATRTRSVVGLMADLSLARDDIGYLLADRTSLLRVIRQLSGWKQGDNIDETVARVEREVLRGRPATGETEIPAAEGGQ